ncbi:MAG: arylesterase [Desulfuromonadaceae bacterium]|nr:arylesterase [Desulfuromonadaceae bacterium]
MTQILHAGFMLLLCGMALLGGCSQPELKPIALDAVILAFGDSLTVGVGADPSQSYPAVLEQLSGRRVVNAGISGEETSGGRQRLTTVLDEYQPQLVILLEGGNDLLRDRDHAAIKNDLAAMIELAQQHGAQVVLLGVPSKNMLVGVPSFYAELAKQYALVFDEELVYSLLRTPGYKSDLIHLNTEGYRALAGAIHERLTHHGAL